MEDTIILMPNGYLSKDGTREISIKTLFEIIQGKNKDPLYQGFQSNLQKNTNKFKKWISETKFNKLIASQEQLSIYQKAKSIMPAYIAGASKVIPGDSHSIEGKNIIELSNYFMVDFDVDKDNHFDIQSKEFKDKLKALPECVAFSNSPTGVRMIIKYFIQDEDLKKESFDNIFKHLQEKLTERYLIGLGILIDENCKNVDRKGIILSDEDAFFKENVTPFILYKDEIIDDSTKDNYSDEFKLTKSKPPEDVLNNFIEKMKIIDNAKADYLFRISKITGGLYAGKGFGEDSSGKLKEEIKSKILEACKENANRTEGKPIKDIKHCKRIIDNAFKHGEKLPLVPIKKNKLKVFTLREFLTMNWPENTPLKCGYPMFDKYELIRKGWITGILGGTSARKSIFLLNIAVRLLKNDYKVLYVIIEGNIKRNMQTVVAQMNEITMLDVKEEHYQNSKFDNISIAFQNYASVTVEDIRDIMKDNSFDAIVLDYVTLLTDKEHELFQKGQIISEKLKNLADDNNVAVITAAQANRGGNNKIKLEREDVGESHGITMTMDVMLGIIKYKKLEKMYRTAIDIIKLRDIPDEIAINEPGEVEGKREYYEIRYNNKILNPIIDEELDKMVEKDIIESENSKGELTKKEHKESKKNENINGPKTKIPTAQEVINSSKLKRKSNFNEIQEKVKEKNKPLV